jgi:zinc transporter ZupT
LAAGAMTAVTVLDIIPEAWGAHPIWATVGFSAGAAVMWQLSGHG